MALQTAAIKNALASAYAAQALYGALYSGGAFELHIKSPCWR